MKTRSSFLTSLGRDGRLAGRQLTRRPAHNAFIVVSLTIGMSICLGVFSIVDVVIFGLRPGITDRHRLMHVRWGSAEGLSPAEVDLVSAALAGPARSIAAESNRPVAMQLPSGAAMVPAAFVSADYFATLGTTPVAGRLLTTTDRDTTVAVISERLWREEFTLDPRIAGRLVRINGAAATIVGVAPAGFPGLALHDIGDTDREAEVWLPGERLGADTRWWVAARLADAASEADLRARSSAITATVRARSAARREGGPVMIFPAAMSWREADPRLLLVLGLYLFVPFSVLAIACVNVLNLQLADAATRARELTVRLALGAGRGTLVTLLALEVVPLAALAAGAGWLAAERFLRLAQPLFTVPLSLSATALAFTASLVVGATVGGGLVPAWLAVRRLRSTGLTRSHDDAVQHTRLRSTLVAAQVAATTVIVFLGALGVHSFERSLPRIPADADRLITAEFRLGELPRSNAHRAEFVSRVLESLVRDRAIAAAGFANFFRMDGAVAIVEDARLPRIFGGGLVTPRWYEATGATLVAGRLPDGSLGGDDRVAVVNEAGAASLGDRTTGILGRSIRVSFPTSAAPQSLPIVGVVANHVMGSDGRGVPMVFLPMPDQPPATVVLTARAAVDARSASAAIRAAVSAADPEVPLALATLRARLEAPARGMGASFGFAALIGKLALVLAAVGLHAVLACTFRRRTHEIGVRLAVGARPRDIASLVYRQSFVLVAAGLAIGFGIGTSLAILLRWAHPLVSPLDTGMVALTTIAALASAGVAASALPAHKASRVDPLTVLREE